MFIDGPKYKKLVEAMKGGDDRAKAILMAQYKGDEGLGDLLEEYFKEPEPEPEVEVVREKPKTHEEKLKAFLDDNGIKEGDPEYDSYVEEFEGAEHHEEKHEHECGCGLGESVQGLIDDEIEAIEGYDKAMLLIVNSDLSDSIKKGIMATYEEIKGEELHHIEELKKVLASVAKGK